MAIVIGSEMACDPDEPTQALPGVDTLTLGEKSYVFCVLSWDDVNPEAVCGPVPPASSCQPEVGRSQPRPERTAEAVRRHRWPSSLPGLIVS